LLAITKRILHLFNFKRKKETRGRGGWRALLDHVREIISDPFNMAQSRQKTFVVPNGIGDFFYRDRSRRGGFATETMNKNGAEEKLPNGLQRRTMDTLKNVKFYSLPNGDV
jgi:hypothetical protein